MDDRPNVVLILADDMGFSDLGCYGGEIRTPSVDGLARDGVRFSQFYNTARCSPSRASLLTGLHPHQTGIGILTNDDRPRGYPGTLNQRCLTAAEVLAAAGYDTALVGKWHLSSDVVNPNDAWPTRRGFGYFFGTLTGCGSYFAPGTLTRGEHNVEDEPGQGEFYYTDAISDEAVGYIERRSPSDPPFFLYVAYTAPHWPLHAPAEARERCRGRYAEGWDELRQRRMQRLRDEGILDEEAVLSDRDPTQPAWDAEPDPEWQQRRMETYAAQVEVMDQGIGRILDALAATGQRDNTLVLFLSDNGASPESLPLIDLESFRARRDIFRLTTRDGRSVRLGNQPDVDPGGEDTYASYGRAWANLSNTPFRFYKRWVHEGGIATPFVASWPGGGLAGGSVSRTPFQLTDVLPTILDATGVECPADYPGRDPLPLEGRSMLPSLRGQSMEEKPLYWEHTGNAAIRHGKWKLVREHPGAWELYDMSQDRSETHDLATDHPDLVRELAEQWQAWADRVGVIPWEETVAIYQAQGLSEDSAAG